MIRGEVINIPPSCILNALQGGKNEIERLAASVKIKSVYGNSMLFNYSINKFKDFLHCQNNKAKAIVENDKKASGRKYTPKYFKLINRTDKNGDPVKGKDNHPITDLLAVKYTFKMNEKPIKLYIYNFEGEKVLSLNKNLSTDQLNSKNSAKTLRDIVRLLRQAITYYMLYKDSINPNSETRRKLVDSATQDGYTFLNTDPVTAEECRRLLIGEETDRKLYIEDIEQLNAGCSSKRLAEKICSNVMKPHTVANTIRQIKALDLVDSRQNEVVLRDFNNRDKVDLSFRPHFNHFGGEAPITYHGRRLNKYERLMWSAGYDDEYFADLTSTNKYKYNALNLYSRKHDCCVGNLMDSNIVYTRNDAETDGMYFLRLSNIYTIKENILGKSKAEKREAKWFTCYKKMRENRRKKNAETIVAYRFTSDGTLEPIKAGDLTSQPAGRLCSKGRRKRNKTGRLCMSITLF